MSCEEIEVLISASIDGEVTDEERRIVEQHLTGCQSCQAAMAEFSELHSLCGEIALKEASSGFRQRVTQRIDNAPGGHVNLSWLRVPRMLYALGFSLLIVLGGVMLATYFRSDTLVISQNGQQQAAVEIEVYAEDFLFGESSFEDMDVLSTVESNTSVGDELWDSMNLTETDTSWFDQGDAPLSLMEYYS